MSVSTDTSTKESTQRLPKWYCYICNLELFTDEEAKLHIHTDEIVREVLDIVALSDKRGGSGATPRPMNDLKRAINELMGYLCHDIDCDYPYTDVCTCGLREAKKRVLELLK